MFCQNFANMALSLVVACETTYWIGDVLFCSLDVLDPRVGHAIDVLSPFISVLCHSDWLFYRESCPRLGVVYPGVRGLPRLRAPGIVPCLISFSRPLVSSWCDHSMLASLLWQCLTVPSLLQSWRTYSVMYAFVYASSSYSLGPIMSFSLIVFLRFYGSRF